jgi:hypothetical protein
VSKTVVVECGDQRFWAYDLALGVWIKKALDHVTAHRYQGDPSPGSAELHDWEHVAVLGSSSIFDLTARSLTAGRRQNFKAIAASVEKWLGLRERLPGPELGAWRLLDGSSVAGADVPAVLEHGVETAPVIDLSRALVSAVLGVLPPAPPATWWAIGFAGERSTIAMRT